ncbi:putative PGG domain-containing protein [Helianthus annuus]|uniref:PGG domain-containing protein n=2 Tax=Helianthus annuus TaxID=4232 RepID=A0A9K3K0B5_HELAN|nr:putative PGG domain-containing protein [Helianthus annuus]KAJ0613372.1 putative PGG domain-containing protein [Helianthus annuus]KAJ0628736.1 putative PGG domain-containing protein [Helianthus annuus]KAJ0785061.1 putative PGG domain-containing protein [Helianthus annuus]KAJ0794330.1 putative PGG domain-containing protein [Helianthus annuus]
MRTGWLLLFRFKVNSYGTSCGWDLNPHHFVYTLIPLDQSLLVIRASPVVLTRGICCGRCGGEREEEIRGDECPQMATTRRTEKMELEEIVPPPCREVRNAEGKTPEELFKESHKDLVIRGMQWISETINQSMVVAALVCTIGFPGGYDQNNGLPILLQDRHFIAFIVMDAISFILSTSSILTFLSIILSRHQRNTELMLQKWVIGHLALLTSILAIVVAFGISFFILYRSAYKSTVPFIVYPSVIILVCLYVPVYFSLYTDAIKAIYSRRYLFRAKHMLYCKI